MYLDENHPQTKELAKYEQFPSKFTPGDLKPGNPYVFREYPKMLIKAHEGPNGKMMTSQDEPRRSLFDGGQAGDDRWNNLKAEVEHFNAKCQQIVRNETEESQYRSMGWRGGHVEAMDFVRERERSLAIEAAEGNYRDRNMSEKAQAERSKFEAENFGHQGEIKEQPSMKGKTLIPASEVAKEHWKTRQAREKKEASSAA